jgi:hypothetical protein
MELVLLVVAAALVVAGVYAIGRRSVPAGTVFLALAALVVAAGASAMTT